MGLDEIRRGWVLSQNREKRGAYQVYWHLCYVCRPKKRKVGGVGVLTQDNTVTIMSKGYYGGHCGSITIRFRGEHRLISY